MLTGVDRFIIDTRKIYDPYPFQCRFHASAAPYGFMGGAAGPGKLLPLLTPIATPSGWTTMGQLSVGDAIFDDGGNICHVVYLSPLDLSPESIQLTFDDGSQQVCCVDHLWLTWDAGELAALTRCSEEFRSKRRANRPLRGLGKKPWTVKMNQDRRYTYKEPSGSVRSAAEIAATLTTRDGRTNHAVRLSLPLQLPEATLPIDPYVLGAWLGDGDTSGGIITGIDASIFEQIAAAGYELESKENRQGFCPRFRVIGLTTQLSALKVRGYKHIPQMYLRASEMQRLALLQGLMDTDGSADAKSGYCEYCSTDKRLADDVFDLCITLGIKATMREDRAKLKGVDCGPRYRVSFTTSRPIFRLKRKLARLPKTTRRTVNFRYITGASKVESVPMRCIQVDSPSHLYLCGRTMIPTHNTMGMLMEQFQACNEFSNEDGPKVHTILFRRTFPMLEATVITRFRESFPRELYRQYNEGKNQVTWLNGATTKFGSMQYEHDVWGWQGQWFHMGYDELCEFTFKQWASVAAWNRCPVSNKPRKYGAGNPIGIGAMWVEDLFVKGIPCMGMDDSQKAAFDPEDYDYFPATYLDNPIFANDPTFLKNLEAYPADVRDALKFGLWGAAGGYFRGVWDENIHVFKDGSVRFPDWYRRWISGNWGYEHPASYYKHCMGPNGEVYTYDELYTQHEQPEDLAEHIAEWAVEENEHGKMEIPQFINFTHSFDAEYSKATATMGADMRSVNQRMTPVLRREGIPIPLPSTRDKLGRDTLMRELLAKRIRYGEDASGHPLEYPGWMVSDKCKQLRRVIPLVKSDPVKVEQIEGSSDGSDSPLQGSGYGLYAIFGRPASKPLQVRQQEYYQSLSPKADMTAKSVLMAKWKQDNNPRKGSAWAARQ